MTTVTEHGHGACSCADRYPLGTLRARLSALLLGPTATVEPPPAPRLGVDVRLDGRPW